jgi:beta-hydroxylase
LQPQTNGAKFLRQLLNGRRGCGILGGPIRRGIGDCNRIRSADDQCMACGLAKDGLLMSFAFGGAWRGGARARRFVKVALRRSALLGVLLLAYVFPKTAAVYAICGLYDVSRNRDFNLMTLRRYFLGNGVLTWILSPINAVLDALSLPYLNKGVYRIDDLPPPHQEEIRRLIQAARDADLVSQLEQRAKDNARTMIFFRWYGANVDTFFDVPAFHQPWKYVQTIGVSIFNHRTSTSRHFGFMRASFRVLYNLNDITDDSAYIVVGDTINYWRDEKLFIFDDTLMHESVNQTDQVRYCLFVDIIRPTMFAPVMRATVTVIRLLTEKFKFVYYKNWKVIR